MNEILRKRRLAQNAIELVISSPQIAKNAKPGQFIILRVDEEGERVPFTLCDSDKVNGTITLLIQVVGYSTQKIDMLGVGDSIHDLIGPLGRATDLEKYNKVLLVGGGIGTAVIYPQAKFLTKINKKADVIIGARNKDYIMYEPEFRNVCDEVFIATDDGSAGIKGFVTDILKEQLNINKDKYDAVFAVGPLVMMRAVSAVTKEFGVKTIVSMNSIMVDGTGMCGGCRLTVGGVTKYACVDGPEFDGHLVDFEEAINRSRFYLQQEKEHICRITGNNNK